MLEANYAGAKWSVSAGILPTGLTLSEAGAITGKLEAAGVYSFTVKAEYEGLEATCEFSIVVAKGEIGGLAETAVEFNVGNLPTAADYAETVAYAKFGTPIGVDGKAVEGSWSAACPAGITAAAKADGIEFTVAAGAAGGAREITVTFNPDNVNYEDGSVKFVITLIGTSGAKIAGTVSSWNDKNDAVIRLYPAAMSDEQVKEAVKSNAPGGVAPDSTEQPVKNGSRYETGYQFANVDSGEYKLAVYKPGGYVISITEVTVYGQDVELNPILNIRGDVNESGTVNATDILWMRQYILKKRELTDEQLKIGDINENGSINVTDVLWARQRILGKRDENYNLK